MLSQGKIVLTGSSGPVRKDYDRKMSARLRRQNPDTQILLAPGIVKRLIESIDSVRPRSKLVGQCGRGIIFRPGLRARPNHQHHQAQRQKGREPREQKTYRRPEMSSVSHRKVRRQAAPKKSFQQQVRPGNEGFAFIPGRFGLATETGFYFFFIATRMGSPSLSAGISNSTV